MGYYIDQDSKGNMLPAKGKVKALIADGAIKIAEGHTGWELPGDVKFQEGLVVVVQNNMFDAAAYAYDEDELMDFIKEDDSRRWKTVLVYKHAARLSGYDPAMHQN